MVDRKLALLPRLVEGVLEQTALFDQSVDLVCD
jgi:hypothetical protein